MSYIARTAVVSCVAATFICEYWHKIRAGQENSPIRLWFALPSITILSLYCYTFEITGNFKKYMSGCILNVIRVPELSASLCF